jgi:hypothetical protein
MRVLITASGMLPGSWPAPCQPLAALAACRRSSLMVSMTGTTADSDLGAAPVDHVAFVVRTIRDHLRGVGCEHHGARLFCPDCGRRTGIGS